VDISAPTGPRGPAAPTRRAALGVLHRGAAFAELRSACYIGRAAFAELRSACYIGRAAFAELRSACYIGRA